MGKVVGLDGKTINMAKGRPSDSVRKLLVDLYLLNRTGRVRAMAVGTLLEGMAARTSVALTNVPISSYAMQGLCEELKDHCHKVFGPGRPPPEYIEDE